MRKIITAILFVISLSSLTAQDFKIKKGNIIMNENIIASIKKENKKYVINDTEGNLLYNAEVKSTTPKGRLAYSEWLELTNRDGNVYELNFKTKSLALNIEKKVVEHMIQSEFLSKNGVDEKKYNQVNIEITNELDKIFDEYEKNYIIEDKLAEENNIKVGKYDNKIFKYPITANEILVGYIKSNQILNPKDGSTLVVYTVSDSNNNDIAELKFGKYDTGKELKPLYIVILNEPKTFPTITKSTFYSIAQDPLAMRMIKILYANGYLK